MLCHFLSHHLPLILTLLSSTRVVDLPVLQLKDENLKWNVELLNIFGNTHTRAHPPSASCWLIYDKGQIVVCLKAFYECVDLVFALHHLSSLLVCVCVCSTAIYTHTLPFFVPHHHHNMDSCSGAIMVPLSCSCYLCSGHSVLSVLDASSWGGGRGQ